MVQLNVQVKDRANQPVAGIYVSVATPSNPPRLPTDSQGGVLFQLEVPTVESRLVVALSAVIPVADADEYAAAVARYQQSVSNNAFRQYYLVDLQPGVDSYNVTIAGRPAVTVSGKVVRPDGTGVESIVFVNDAPLPVPQEPSPVDGTFVVGGVPAGEAADLFLWPGEDNAVRVVHLTAAQTSSDVALGDLIVAPPAIGTVPVRIIVSNARGMPFVPTMKEYWVTVVSQDGAGIWSFRVDETGRAWADLHSATPVMLSPGTYFVVAGPIMYNRAAAGLVRALQDGRVADIEAAGVATFTVQGTTEMIVPIDAAATEAAVWTVIPER
ncbi:MAG: hypothetical protein KF745_10680 [Phycisphaeraceae bacterium]|nr:hypothetical protein [Phycisphaeraceae bacterium]